MRLRTHALIEAPWKTAFSSPLAATAYSLISALAALCLTPAAASATNYYVAPPPTGNDVNSGELSEGARHQWATLKHANEKVKPGDEVFVETGTYNENGLQLTKSGIGPGLSERIIYHVSYGETATLEGAVQIAASYVVLEGSPFAPAPVLA